MKSFAHGAGLILRNDLRLRWRDLLSGRWKGFLSVALLVVFLIAAHAVAVPVIYFLPRASLMIETIIWMILGSLMLGTAMNQTIVVLFERSDFDLLLASPIPARSVLLARIATVVTIAALEVAFFLLPLLNGAIVGWSRGYITGYIVWVVLACIVASASMWFALLLVRWLGPRRARTWTQVAAAVFGAAFYLAFRAQTLTGPRGAAVLGSFRGVLASAPVEVIARAARGDARALAPLLVVAIVFVGITVRLLARQFIRGAQEGNAITPKGSRRGPRSYIFRDGLLRVTYYKDLRLIMREPLLLTQVLPVVLYIGPVFFPFARRGLAPLLAPIALVLAVQLSGVLTLVSAAGEECWDLIQMSPTNEIQLRWAKLLAGVSVPLLVATLICCAVALLGHPVIAFLALAFSVLCSVGCSWLSVTQIRPSPRRDLLRRAGGARESFARSIVRAVVMFSGAFGLGLAQSAHWIAGTLLLGFAGLTAVACLALAEVETAAPPGQTPA